MQLNNNFDSGVLIFFLRFVSNQTNAHLASLQWINKQNTTSSITTLNKAFWYDLYVTLRFLLFIFLS